MKQRTRDDLKPTSTADGSISEPYPDSYRYRAERPLEDDDQWQENLRVIEESTYDA